MTRPSYYDAFRCIAGDCRHSCCVGWEIDLDEETLSRWEALPERDRCDIFRHVETGETPHLRLDEAERCPFLNQDGLCRLILAYGEEVLSQICRDHPRFRSFWPGFEEIGLGAACEAAAALILQQKVRPQLLDAAEPEDPDAAVLYRLREQLFAVSWEESKTIAEREAEILRLAGGNISEKEFVKWIELYLSLERLDETWTELLEAMREVDERQLAAFDRHMSDRQTEVAAMLHYFLYRHFPAALADEDPGSKAAFAVLSCRMLRAAGAAVLAKTGSFTTQDQIELLRLYSSEIEYSEDNTAALYDVLWEEE